MLEKKSKPRAVLISDIHFTVDTLERASSSLRAALALANQLIVPLIICGDTLDSKAIIRAECSNELLKIIEQAPTIVDNTYVLVGNHDLLNEKSSETSLEFLRNTFCTLVTEPYFDAYLGMALIPYQSSQERLKQFLSTLPLGTTIIAHQGIKTAYMGHYSQDTSSLEPEVFDGYRVISGHYHKRQDIKCGKTGLFSYVGNPYTLTFAEAEDGPKGIRVLHEDGTLDFIDLNLPRHRKFYCKFEELESFISSHSEEDKIWLVVKGKKSDLDTINKKTLGNNLFGTEDYKLELVVEDTSVAVRDSKPDISNTELLDELIASTKENEYRKAYLKALWRSLLNEDPIS